MLNQEFVLYHPHYIGKSETTFKIRLNNNQKDVKLFQVELSLDMTEITLLNMQSLL